MDITYHQAADLAYRTRHWIAIPLLLALSACGGSSSSGGGSTLASPTSLDATPGNSEVTLSWASVEGATGYHIYYSTDADIDINNPGTGSGNWDWLSDVVPPLAVDQLDNGTVYYFVVTAVEGSRESAPSNEISATPRAGISGRTIQTTGRIIDPQDYQHTMTATFCDEGQIAAGGGFRIISSGTDGALQIHSSFPESAGSASNATYTWGGRAFNDNAAGSMTVQTQVICIDRPEGFELVRNVSQSLPANGDAVFSAECSDGNVAMAGGAVLQGVNHDDPGIRLAYSQRDNDADAIWNTTLHDVSGDAHSNMAAHAICSVPLRGQSMETTYTVRPEDWVAANSFGERTARCAPGQVVTHGGLYRLGGAAGQVTDLVLQQSYADIDDQDRHVWRARVYNSAAEARPMGAFAMCVDSDD